LTKYNSKENGFLVFVTSEGKWKMKETDAVLLHILQRYGRRNLFRKNHPKYDLFLQQLNNQSNFFPSHCFSFLLSRCTCLHFLQYGQQIRSGSCMFRNIWKCLQLLKIKLQPPKSHWDLSC